MRPDAWRSRRACAGLVAVAMVLGLSACGADAPPRAPEPAPPPGLSVTGEARIGVVGTL